MSVPGAMLSNAMVAAIPADEAVVSNPTLTNPELAADDRRPSANG